MLKVVKRGRRYYARGTQDGRRVFKSLETKDAGVAAKRLHKLETEYERGLVRADWQKFRTMFDGVGVAHLAPATRKEYLRVMGLFSRFIEKRISRVDQLTPLMVTEYVDARLHAPASQNRKLTWDGAKNELRILRAAFNRAIEWGMLERNPVRQKKLNPEGGKVLPFSTEEIARMEADRVLLRSPRLRAAFYLLLYTGLRLGDTRELRWSAVDFEAGRITVRTTKRKTIVIVPINSKLRCALIDLRQVSLACRPADLVFPGRTGRPPKNFKRWLERLYERAGVAGGHAHRFRHTFAVQCLQAGLTLNDVARLLGNSPMVVEKHYSQFDSATLERRNAFISQVLENFANPRPDAPEAPARPVIQ
jgi:integrase/recombinase XerD